MLARRTGCIVAAHNFVAVHSFVADMYVLADKVVAVAGIAVGRIAAVVAGTRHTAPHSPVGHWVGKTGPWAPACSPAAHTQMSSTAGAGRTRPVYMTAYCMDYCGFEYYG